MLLVSRFLSNSNCVLCYATILFGALSAAGKQAIAIFQMFNVIYVAGISPQFRITFFNNNGHFLRYRMKLKPRMFLLYVTQKYTVNS